MKFPPEQLKAWLQRHASLELLCEYDGWPDTGNMQVEIQETKIDCLRLFVTFDEIVNAAEYRRGPIRRSGYFDLHLDEDGQPYSAILIQMF